MMRISKKGVVAGGILVILVFLPLIAHSPFVLSILVSTFLYAFAGQGWNVQAGYCGQWSLGHALFFGMGAYGVVLASFYLHTTPFLGVIFGIGLSILFALLVVALSFKLRGVFFSMATLVAPYIVEPLIGHYSKTRVGGIIQGGWIGHSFSTPPLQLIHYYYILLLPVIASLVLVRVLERSRLGYFMVAARDDERLALSLGINTYKTKILAGIISALLTSIAGSIYAMYLGYVNPKILEFPTSLYILLGPSIGGVGTVLGPLIGSLVVIPSLQLFQSYIGGKHIGMTYVLGGALLMLAYMIQQKIASLRRR